MSLHEFPEALDHGTLTLPRMKTFAIVPGFDDSVVAFVVELDPAFHLSAEDQALQHAAWKLANKRP